MGSNRMLHTHTFLRRDVEVPKMMEDVPNLKPKFGWRGGQFCSGFADTSFSVRPEVVGRF